MSISLFDDDLYKFTMQQAVLLKYPEAIAVSKFKNRGTHKFTQEFLTRFELALKNMGEIRAPDDQLEQFTKLRFVKPFFVDYLHNYRYDTSQVKASFDYDGNLQITIKGPWHSTILWEVKLMSLISEIYFTTIDLDWNMDGQEEKIIAKAKRLADGQARFADFGTRRRRSYKTQQLIVDTLFGIDAGSSFLPRNFIGTSNVEMALKHESTPIGTMAHEWTQAIAVLESLNHANRYMLQSWLDVYGGDLGTALTDTFRDKAFFDDFEMRFAKLFDGVRHDSGDPREYIHRVAAHYQSLNINPISKTIVFSNGLDDTEAVQIAAICRDAGIGHAFGIGTFLTNDFMNTKTKEKSQPLNMVIKLWSINGKPVVKLSNDPGKESGELQAVERMKAIYT